jgi:hypothetical protein
MFVETTKCTDNQITIGESMGINSENRVLQEMSTWFAKFMNHPAGPKVLPIEIDNSINR